MKPPDTENFEFVGMRTETTNGVRALSQRKYVSRLQLLPASATISDFTSMRAKVSWVTHTRPDISCAVSQAAKVRQNEFGVNDIKALNNVIKYLRATPEITLSFPKLDIDMLRIVVYTDASFANNVDLSSQLGYVVTLTDASRKAAVLHYQGSKSHRVTRSSMASETLAFAHGFDAAFLIRHYLERMLGRVIPLVMLTDSKALFDILTRNNHPWNDD
jgi:hypothetical protein